MAVQRNIIGKTLLVGVILLFFGISIQPCIAVLQNKDMIDSYSEPFGPIGEPDWLADMEVEFGEEINNGKIYLTPEHGLPVKDYYVNVDVKFRCPADKMIVIDYLFEVILTDDWVEKTFLEYSKTFTIINGSNPPDINENFTHYISPNNWLVILRIVASLTVNEFLYGEWVEVSNDSIWRQEAAEILFFNSRASERTQMFMRIFESFPNLFPFLKQLKEIVEVFRI